MTRPLKNHMSTQRDYYEVLGVQRGASVDDVKKAYRQLVMQHHPDRVADPAKKKEAEERFKEISEAYAVLSDPQKRQLYDQYGHQGVDSRYSTEDIFRGADFGDIFRGMGGGGGSGSFEDILSSFGFDFGGGGGRSQSRQHQGDDIHLELQITLEEAHSGLGKDISYNYHEACDACSGTGAQKGAGRVTCSTCKGRGMVSTGMGFISFAQTCPACHGDGQIIKQKCNACGGSGRVRKSKNLKVTIPAGVDTGSVLRLRDEGNFASGGKGDLFLHINVKAHPSFQRNGDDIHHKHKISVIKALIGGDIEVPSLSGNVQMKVPAGTQPGTTFRLKGKGIMDLQTKRTGDEYVEVEVEIPTRLSGQERKLIDEWAKLRST